MGGDKILEGVVLGIVSGTVTGIILAIFFWATGQFRLNIERRNQIRFLSATIEGFRDKIFSAEDIETTLGDRQVQYSKDNVRKAYFDDMRRNVESILQERASRLSYDEVQEVRSAFFTDLYPDVILNDSGYNNIFTKLESIKWLKLSRRDC